MIVSMNADASFFVQPCIPLGTVRPMDLQTARIMLSCLSDAKLEGSVTVPPSVGREVIRLTFCISSLEGRLSSDVPQKLCMGKFDKHLPRLEVSQFSSELVLLTFP